MVREGKLGEGRRNIRLGLRWISETQGGEGMDDERSGREDGFECRRVFTM
jgi:hypothetical protein